MQSNTKSTRKAPIDQNLTKKNKKDQINMAAGGRSSTFASKKRMIHQRERIAWYVLRGELLDNGDLHRVFRSLGGNTNLRGRAARTEWLIRHVTPQELEQHFCLEHVRVCSHCGHPMCWGYCVDGGSEHYCSEECLRQHYSEEELRQLYADGCGDTYYTSWID